MDIQESVVEMRHVFLLRSLLKSKETGKPREEIPLVKYDKKEKVIRIGERVVIELYLRRKKDKFVVGFWRKERHLNLRLTEHGAFDDFDYAKIAAIAIFETIKTLDV